jgi:integrase
VLTSRGFVNKLNRFKGIEVLGIYCEEGASAKTAQRAEFLRAIEFCRKHKGKVDAFVVYKVDRFARNTEDHFYVRKTLLDYGVTLHSVTEPIGNKTLKEVIEDMPKVGEYIYCYKATGKPYRYRSKLINSLCRKAEVKKFTYHNLRHYGASRLAEAGVSITDIQYLLGHQRATTTDIYLQSISESLKEAMKNLE